MQKSTYCLDSLVEMGKGRPWMNPICRDTVLGRCTNNPIEELLGKPFVKIWKERRLDHISLSFFSCSSSTSKTIGQVNQEGPLVETHKRRI